MSLTMKILIGMIAGVVVGVVCNAVGNSFVNETIIAGFLGMIGTMFVNALKMLVVPLVVFSLICGVTGIGDIKVLGRVGGQFGAERREMTALGAGSRLAMQTAGAAPVREQFSPGGQVDGRVASSRVVHRGSCCSNCSSMARRARW